jgi:hypothetical protein
MEEAIGTGAAFDAPCEGCVLGKHCCRCICCNEPPEPRRETPTVREICDFIERFPQARHTTEQVVTHFLGYAGRFNDPNYSAVVDRLQRARKWTSKLRRRSWKITRVERVDRRRGAGAYTRLYQLEEA